jgi:hypothetical protein
MILVRNVFQIEFGKAKDAVALWKEGLEIARRGGHLKREARLLTDLAGVPFYTLVLELTFESMEEQETHSRKLMEDPAWRAWYPRVAALTRGGHREILNLVS